ncbi:MAG: Fe-S cluster assembly protein SufD, partial [Polaribacter sp.]
MELNDKLLSSYVAFENRVDTNSDIHEIRSEAFQNFEKLGFPTKKLEAWKYTSLNSVLKQDYSLFPNKENSIQLADVQKYFIHDIDTYK